MPFAPPVHRHAGYRTFKEVKRERDKQRRTAYARGYDAEWQALRLEFLAQHPFCECDEHKGSDYRAFAEVVDHIKTIEERPDLRLEWKNLRSMTKRCHDRHTAKTQGFGRR